jgi:hypothetical protein
MFNLDETGLSDWEVRRSKPVLLTADAANRPLPYPVDRVIRHPTLLCCTSASGDAHCPLFLSANRAVLGLFEKGVCENIDLQIKILSSPYVTGESFIKYPGTVLIPMWRAIAHCLGAKITPQSYFVTIVPVIVQMKSNGSWPSMQSSSLHIRHTPAIFSRSSTLCSSGD